VIAPFRDANPVREHDFGGALGPIFLGTQNDAGGNAIAGCMDDIRIYNYAVAEEDIAELMEEGQGRQYASLPMPGSGDIDIPRDVTLSWSAGEHVSTHQVYVSTSFDDVNDADINSPLSVTTGSVASYTPGRLNFEQTYFWRVDEVNAAPDKTVFKGEVWSFTVEPKALPVTQITATASGASPGMEASKTIDGSGLAEDDTHSSLPTDMWLTMTDGSWIQYQFDTAYKLDTLLIWNSNQAIEGFIGFGVKEAVIETSLDGETWTTVENVPGFAKATGLASNTVNATVELGGVVAKYVKISPISAHGITGQSGLSEVRFMYIPTAPRESEPADGATTAGLNVTLAWRAGREAASHDVLLSMDRTTIADAPVVSTSEPAHMPDMLDLGTTYYWQVVEVNDAETPTRYAGPIWSFTTATYRAFEDFESYTGDEGEEVFMSWWDGFGGDVALGGSTTGTIDAPFVETRIVHGGRQSLPLYFDNNGGFVNIDGTMTSPRFSEVVYEFDGNEDLIEGNATTLAVSFHGEAPVDADGNPIAGETDPLYLILEDSTGKTVTVTHPDAAAVQTAEWQDWLIPLTTFDTLRIDRIKAVIMGIGYKDGSQAGSEGILYIDDLRVGAP
jgi:hypothetical protein